MNGSDSCEVDQQWTVLKDNTYQACGATVTRLPSGAYSLTSDCYGRLLFQKRRLQLDDLIDFSDSLAARVLAEMNHFWGLGERFHQYGFLHRRGYLFYGKQGGGKSSLIHLILDRIIREDKVAFWCEYPDHFVKGAEVFAGSNPIARCFAFLRTSTRSSATMATWCCCNGWTGITK